jgi:hypothetical protein
MTVVGPLLALPINDGGWLEISCHEYPGRRITPLHCLNVWHWGLLLLQRGLAALGGLVAGSSAAMGMVKLGCVEGSTEGKVEKDLLVGTGNLTIRKSNWKMEQGDGQSRRAEISAGLGYGSSCDHWWELCCPWTIKRG